MPKGRQSLLFSATIPNNVADFASSGITDYKLIKLDEESKLSDDLLLRFFMTRATDKPATFLLLLRELVDIKREQTMVFAATRHHVEYLHELAEAAGIHTTYVFGAMDATAREINI
jgi:ATP-dependent RNA helicase DDX54/DBP10